MKKMITMTALSLVLAAGSISKGLTEDPRTMIALHGYTLKNKPAPRADFNIWVVTHESAFTDEFVAGSEATIKPNFEKQLVVAASAQTANYTYRVSFQKSFVDKHGLHVYFRVKKIAPDEENNSVVTLAALEKSPGLKKVSFYHDNILVRTVPIVAVY